MEVTIFGTICFLLIFVLLIRQVNPLLAAVFFAPFCASAVIQADFFYLQPGHFFLFLTMICSLVKGRVKIHMPNGMVFGFILFALLTIIISAVFRIDVLVYGIGNRIQLKSSLVSLQNFTQYAYIVLGFILYWMVYNYSIQDMKNWRRIVNIFAKSGITVLCIGVYQIIANNYSLPFDEVFRNSVRDMWQTKERVQGTFGEASFMGQFCVYLFAVFSTYKWHKSGVIRITGIALTMLIGVLTRSSGFLLGIIAVAFIWLFLQKLSLKTLIQVLMLAIVAVLAGWFVIRLPSVQVILDNAYSKYTLQSWSGIERNTVFWHMLMVGRKYPISGIGYGGGRSTDLYANLFSTTGIVGFALFFGFIMQKVYQLFRVYGYTKEEQMGILLVVAILVTSISVPDIAYLPIWVIFGLLDGLTAHKTRTKALSNHRIT